MTTWNPLDTSSAIALSDGNLTATSSGVGSVRATDSKSAGKWYWEILVINNASGNVIGVQSPTSNLGGYTGQDSEGWGYYHPGGVLHGSGLNGSQSSYAPGDVIGCALDMDALTLQFHRNGAPTGSLITGMTATIFASIGAGSGGVSVKANFGGTPFTYTPPSGFSAYGQAALGATAVFLSSTGFPLIRLGQPGPKFPKPFFGFSILDAYFGGNGRISGTVRIKGSPDAPTHRRVRLIRDQDGVMIREQWSDPITGTYLFEGVDPSVKYSVVTYDHTGVYNAVIKDFVTPDPMP